ncbi:hypothetical protein AB1Y20_021648 [Prymnesium parvum]|uniref:G-protein coupled receptors family 2 profile 2 domain-containing protein n=1 Tax=Prymnesium parvum TaxID=97485 RepID=A0AB34JK26_PRYPA
MQEPPPPLAATSSWSLSFASPYPPPLPSSHVAPPSPPEPYDAHELTAQLAACIGLISVFGSLAVLLSVFLHPRAYRMNDYIASMSVASLLNATAFVWDWVSHGEPGLQCTVQATLFIISEDAMAIWSLAVVVAIYQVVVWRRHDRLQLPCHVLGWAIPVCMAVLLLGFNLEGPITSRRGLWCWIRNADSALTQGSAEWVAVVAIDLFRWLLFLLITFLYFRVRRAFGSLVHEGLLAPSREQRALSRLRLHILVFLATRILFVLQNVHSILWPAHPLPWPVYVCSAALAASTGALHAVVYGCSPEVPLCSWHERATGCNLFASCHGCLASLGLASSPTPCASPLSSPVSASTESPSPFYRSPIARLGPAAWRVEERSPSSLAARAAFMVATPYI